MAFLQLHCFVNVSSLALLIPTCFWYPIGWSCSVPLIAAWTTSSYPQKGCMHVGYAPTTGKKRAWNLIEPIEFKTVWLCLTIVRSPIAFVWLTKTLERQHKHASINDIHGTTCDWLSLWMLHTPIFGYGMQNCIRLLCQDEHSNWIQEFRWWPSPVTMLSKNGKTCESNTIRLHVSSLYRFLHTLCN